MMTRSGAWSRTFLFVLWSQVAWSAPPNIVLVSVDGLRADRTHFGGNPRLTTPNLDALAKDGVTFTHAWSQANESLFSHAAIFTGRYPWELGTPNYIRYVLPEEAITIQETLKLVGYRTGSFQAGGHIGENFGFAQGFDHHHQAEDFGSFFHTVPQATAWLDTLRSEGDAPFFVFLHGYDCHRPYALGSIFHHAFDSAYTGPMERILRARNHTESIFNKVFYKPINYNRLWHENGHQMLDPAGYLELAENAAAGKLEKLIDLDDADLHHMLAHYDSGVLSADTYVGIFLEYLGRAGLWDDTLVIVTSDHGEDLQQHGFTNHRAVLRDSTTRVPLILSGGAVPEAWRGKVVTDLTDAVDLFATIADVAGTVPPASASGRSLWALMEGTVDAKPKLVFQQGVLGQIAVRTGTHRLVFRGLFPLDPEYETVLMGAPLDSEHFLLFDTRTDPEESKDIKASQPETLSTLVKALRGWFQGLERSDKTTQITPEQLKMLRDRGYW